MQGTSWQLPELKRFLAANADDPLLGARTVFLSNPREMLRLGRLLREHLWPVVRDSLEGTPLRVLNPGGNLPESIIDAERYEFTALCLRFVFEHPERPVGPGNTSPWFYRGEIRCSTVDWMFESYFSLHLPADMAFQSLRQLLSDPEFQGIPPTMNFEISAQGAESWSIDFRKGAGAGWLVESLDETLESVSKRLRRIHEVIDAAEILSQDYGSPFSLKRIHSSLRRAFGGSGSDDDD